MVRLPGWGALFGASAFGATLVATRWLGFALVAAGIGAGLPGALQRRRAERRRVARREALAQLAGRLRDGIRGARSLPDAIALAAETAPSALKEDLGVLRATVADRGAAEGLETLAAATDDVMLRRFARSLAGAYRTGSRKTGELLDIVAETAWLQSRTEREIRSRQTHIRMARHIIAAVPLVVLVVLRVTNPGFVEAYGTPTGQLVMLGGLGLIALGWWVAGWIGRRT